MTSKSGLVVLDTNILVHLVRGRAAGCHLDSTYGLSTAAVRPLISVTTVGECLSLAKQFGWGSSKEKLLVGLLKQLVVVDINDPKVLDAYADIDFASRKGGEQDGQERPLDRSGRRGRQRVASDHGQGLSSPGPILSPRRVGGPADAPEGSLAVDFEGNQNGRSSEWTRSSKRLSWRPVAGTQR